MTSLSQIDIASSGQRFREQAAGVMQLLAAMEQSLARCAGQGIDAEAFAVFVQQQAAFAAATEQLRRTHEQLGQRLEVHSAVGEDLHRLSVNLRPSSLDRYGPVPALGVGLDERVPSDVETAL